MDDWLTANANMVHLFLLDGATGILKAQRMISISFFENIRDVLNNPPSRQTK